MLQSRKMSIFHLPFPEIFLFIFSNENMKLFMGKAFVKLFLNNSQKMVKMVKKKWLHEHQEIVLAFTGLILLQFEHWGIKMM